MIEGQRWVARGNTHTGRVARGIGQTFNHGPVRASQRVL